MQIKILQQLFLDARRHAIAKQCAIGNDHPATPTHLKRAHDELHKQQRRLAGTGGFGEI